MPLEAILWILWNPFWPKFETCSFVLIRPWVALVCHALMLLWNEYPRHVSQWALKPIEWASLGTNPNKTSKLKAQREDWEASRAWTNFAQLSKYSSASQCEELASCTTKGTMNSGQQFNCFPFFFNLNLVLKQAHYFYQPIKRQTKNM